MATQRKDRRNVLSDAETRSRGAQGCAATGAALHEPGSRQRAKAQRFLLLEDSIWDHDAQKEGRITTCDGGAALSLESG